MALLGKLFKDPEDDETLMGTEDEFYSVSEEEAVKEADPNWQLGQPFDANIVRNITREDVENRIVKGSSEFALKPRQSLDIKV